MNDAQIAILKTDRSTAGTAYVNALATFAAAYINLSALDSLMLSAVNPATPSFGPPPDTIPLRHAQFSPDGVAPWANAIATRRVAAEAEIIAASGG